MGNYNELMGKWEKPDKVRIVFALMKAIELKYSSIKISKKPKNDFESANCANCAYLSDPGVPGVRSMGPVLPHLSKTFCKLN